MKKFFLLIFVLFFTGCSVQPIKDDGSKPSNDIKSEYRDWWNVLHYSISIEPNYNEKFIKGNVEIDLEVASNVGEFMQIDLQEPMQIKQVMTIELQDDSTNHYNIIPLDNLVRRRNHYLIPTKFLKPLKKLEGIKILFEGKPKLAKNAPWDGGWIFTKDKLNRPWMSVAVQGLGASAWFPCKDYQGDEPEFGANLSIIVPEELVAVGNGKLWKSSFVKNEAGNNVYTWQVVNPINSYNITPNIGNYTSWNDEYEGVNGKLKLNYYVLDYNLEKAKKQFQQVKPMLKIFEDWFGAYPFYNDSYKLVETPFLGMEHQSNIAYGNGYSNGYLGEDRSGSGWGNQFDFIIIHESAHEWFGNNISTKNIADLWVHEAFTTYAEVIYVEEMFGKKAANAYLYGLRKAILNDKPMLGDYVLNKPGSVDIYNKGAAMIHTLRAWMNNDENFKSLLKNMNKDFYHAVISGEKLEKYLTQKTGLSLETFFNQYLRTVKIPTLEFKKEKNKMLYRWANVVEGFAMPIDFEDGTRLNPTENWKETDTTYFDKKINPDFYIDVKR